MDIVKDRYASLDLQFKCGCVLGEHNKRIIAKDLRRELGWRVVLNSVCETGTPVCCLKVERNSIK